MPTNPVETIAPKEIQKEVADLLNAWSEHISELVNFGSHILSWLGNTGSLSGDGGMVCILTFRNVLEIIDSIAILFSKSCIDPCKLQIRTLFESMLMIRYLVDGESKRRALDYLVCHFHSKLDIYSKLDAKTPMGKQWQQELTNDSLAGSMRLPAIPDLDQKISNLESLLQKPDYIESEEEYQRLRSLKNRAPAWYEFHDGPRSVIELARHLKLIGLYNILYRYYSKSVHGLDVIDQRISKASSGEGLISQIRNPRDAQNLCSIAFGLSLDVYRTLIDCYVPGRKKQFAMWYRVEIRDFYLRLSSTQLLTVN